MDIYKATVNYILKLPLMKAWPQATFLLNYAASKEPRDWRLPLLACQAVGESVKQGIPASACIACALIGILLIDDMLDDDPRGEFRRIGPAQAANFASLFLTSSSHAILYSEIAPAAKLVALESLNQMITTIAFGQFLDIQVPTNEAEYWKVVKMKSSPFFRTTLELGTLFGGASAEMVGKIGKIGTIYGEMIQIHDDMNDTMTSPAGPDWVQGRSPLPILYAQLVRHEDRRRFLALRKQFSDENALHEAQEILIKSGGISYCIYHLLYRYQQVHAISTRLKLAHPEKLNLILDEVIIPVWKFFEDSGEQPPEILIHASKNWKSKK